jgi:TolA-binding protein
MKTIDFSYFIERYISGEMDQNEKTWFEKELAGNPTLQKELILRKKADVALLHHDLIDLRKKLTVLETRRKEKVVASGARKGVVLRFAATVAALMLLGGLYLISTGKQSNEALYKKNFRDYISSGTSRTGESKYSEYQAALDLYNKNDFANAAVRFREYLKSKPKANEANLFYGVSEMKNNNFPAAKSSFKTIIDNADNLYIDRAQWYLALCYVRTNEKEEALGQLGSIVNTNSKYRYQAKDLIKKLR